MPPSKPKKVERPKLPKGEEKGKSITLRFNVDDLKRVNAAAKDRKQNLSDWIRGRLMQQFNSHPANSRDFPSHPVKLGHDQAIHKIAVRYGAEL